MAQHMAQHIAMKLASARMAMRIFMSQKGGLVRRANIVQNSLRNSLYKPHAVAWNDRKFPRQAGPIAFGRVAPEDEYDACCVGSTPAPAAGVQRGNKTTFH